MSLLQLRRIDLKYYITPLCFFAVLVRNRFIIDAAPLPPSPCPACIPHSHHSNWMHPAGVCFKVSHPKTTNPNLRNGFRPQGPIHSFCTPTGPAPIALGPVEDAHTPYFRAPAPGSSLTSCRPIMCSYLHP